MRAALTRVARGMVVPLLRSRMCLVPPSAHVVQSTRYFVSRVPHVLPVPLARRFASEPPSAFSPNSVGLRKDGPEDDVVDPSTPEPNPEELARFVRPAEQEAQFELKEPTAVFPNSFLRLSEINIFGFDFDYTLASYTPNLQYLIYDLARTYMVEELKYPRSLLDLRYDPEFAIRGLYYDTNRGYLLKIDFLYNLQVGAAFFGRRKLELHELQHAYGVGLHVGLRHRPILRPLNDLFCLPEACLLADIVQHFVMNHIEFEPMYVFEDVTRAISHVHSTGLMHRHIMADFQRYLTRSPMIVELLRRMRSAGKQLFLLTNSAFAFIDAGMRFLTDDSNWRLLFDVIVTSADKPKWYSTNRPFRKVLTDGASYGKIDWGVVRQFERHSAYVHGSLDELHKITGWHGRRVLYFGDQLYTDLVEPGKWRGWRTGAIIRELEFEIQTQNTPEYRTHLARVLQLERQISQLYSVGAPPDEVEPLKNMRNSLRKRLKEMFNKSFGSVFRTHTNATLFAYNLQRDATIYTSRLENLLQYSLSHCFYPERRYLPHETPVLTPAAQPVPRGSRVADESDGEDEPQNAGHWVASSQPGSGGGGGIGGIVNPTATAATAAAAAEMTTSTEGAQQGAAASVAPPPGTTPPMAQFTPFVGEPNSQAAPPTES